MEVFIKQGGIELMTTKLTIGYLEIGVTFFTSWPRQVSKMKDK